jgi:hypothetical protein
MVGRHSIDSMTRTTLIVAVVAVLGWTMLVGCASRSARGTQEWPTKSELRPRLAQLRRGMPHHEVVQTLKIALDLGSGTMNWWVCGYPLVIRRGSLDAFEHLDYDLAVAFDCHGTNEMTLSQATLTSRGGGSESWPK